MKRTVQHYVRSCVTCQRYKAARHKPYGLLQSHEVPTRPFEHVSLDMITDLLECDGYYVVVVFVCMLTKRTIVEPITNTITTEQLAKVMHRAILRHFGLPRKLISDRDPRFMSEFWRTLFRVVCAKLNISTSYHPQTDGQTERVNQTWEQVTRCFVHPLHDDWVQHLTNVEFAINAAVSTL
jgi:transposase InsO family protein